jgi:hypothetical protein
MPKIDRQKSTKKGAIPTTANPPKGLDEKRRRDRMLKKAKRYQDAARSREAAMGDKNIHMSVIRLSLMVKNLTLQKNFQKLI